MIETKAGMLDEIDAIRAEHHACTARFLASRIGIAQTSVFRMLQGLKDEGLVTWTDMPGSLRATRPTSNGDLPAPVPGVVPLVTRSPLPPPPPPQQTPPSRVSVPKKTPGKKSGAARKRPSRAEARARKAAREAAALAEQ